MEPSIPSNDGVSGSTIEDHLFQNKGVKLNALPGVDKEEFWETCPLGNPETWDPVLRSFSAFVLSLSHPAGVYWGDELVLLHNAAWKKAAGDAAKQAQPQKEIFSEEALSTIRTAMLGNARQSLEAQLFLKTQPRDGKSYQAQLSPAVDSKGNNSGAIIQLFLTTAEQEGKKAERQDMIDEVQESLSNYSNTSTNLPLDENPFFQKFASILPTGLAILNHEAHAVFVNEQFFELTTSVEQEFRSWPNSIHPDDHKRVMDAYNESLGKGGQPLRIEFRTAGPKDAWRLLLLSPLQEGFVKDESIAQYGGFLCAVIDITPNKRQELAQKKMAQEALERKEQQERFIDMISHEIRNPLSAILHCTEEIVDAVEDNKMDSSGISKVPTSMVLESAETIKLCIAHQKNIVDDILSFSKLDAAMLSLCPRSVQPRKQLADTMKMFQPEIKKQQMKMDYVIDLSYDELNVDWVKADLIRISQILVNLVTNAIKFTAPKDPDHRNITTMVGASIKRPTSYPPNVVFFDSDELGYRMDGTSTSEWGNGEAFYIMVAVKDSGIGISDENQKKLFQRFRQATPKTEENYGGSGLGLMISRKLCQLHGGEIGVSSIEGEGSTFGFFFKVRRVEDEGRPSPAERLDSDDMEKQLHEITKGKAPIEDVADADKSENLKDPPHERTEAAGNVVQADRQFHNTAEIASHVKQHKEDEYGQKGRPQFPASTGSGRQVSTLEKLQAKTDEHKDKDKERSRSRQPSEGTTPGSSADSNGDFMHVLLVEDNIINQRILKRKLEAKKFKVTTANNGREAVNAVMQHCSTTGQEELFAEDQSALFDVVLMDQEMPVLDGNAATREIRGLEGDGKVVHLPILGVTANVRDEQKDDMRNAGMDDVISKPYAVGDLVGKIKGLMERRGRSR